MSLAQIGEFAFVLLSRASNLHLVEVCNLLRFVMVLKPLLFFFLPMEVDLIITSLFS